jgi:hypothetical protein
MNLEAQHNLRVKCVFMLIPLETVTLESLNPQSRIGLIFFE